MVTFIGGLLSLFQVNGNTGSGACIIERKQQKLVQYVFPFKGALTKRFLPKLSMILCLK
jgi:hypothetical protein